MLLQLYNSAEYSRVDRDTVTDSQTPKNFNKMESQQMNYTTATKNLYFPKKDQAIIIDALEGFSIRDYIKEITKIINPANIRFISRISNNRICIYFATKEIANDLVEKTKTIMLGNSSIQIRPLISKARRIILSNVCSLISHENIEKILNQINIRLVWYKMIWKDRIINISIQNKFKGRFLKFTFNFLRHRFIRVRVNGVLSPPIETENDIHIIKLHINNHTIKETKELKILGLTFDKEMLWKPHIMKLKKDCTKRSNILKILAAKNWDADFKVLFNIYKSIVLPKLDYASIIYGTTATSKTLNSIQNSNLRLALRAFRTGPVSSLLAEAGIIPLEYRKMKLTCNYICKLVTNPTNRIHKLTFNYEHKEIYNTVKKRYKPLSIRVDKICEENLSFH